MYAALGLEVFTQLVRCERVHLQVETPASQEIGTRRLEFAGAGTQ